MAQVSAHNCKFENSFFDFTNFKSADVSNSDFRGSMFYETYFTDTLADRCKITSLSGIVDPSSSLKLQIVDIKGLWLEKVERSYKGKCWINVKTPENISGRLKLSERSWIEFQGSLDQGRFYVEGIEYLDNGFILSDHHLEELQLQKLPPVVFSIITRCTGTTYSGKSQLLRKIKKDLYQFDEDLALLKAEVLNKNIPSERHNERILNIINIVGVENLRGFHVDLEGWFTYIENQILFKHFELEKAKSEAGKFAGWLTLTAGNDNNLVLLPRTNQKTSQKERPRIFERSAI